MARHEREHLLGGAKGLGRNKIRGGGPYQGWYRLQGVESFNTKMEGDDWGLS
jgi:hypothetical protein